MYVTSWIQDALLLSHFLETGRVAIETVRDRHRGEMEADGLLLGMEMVSGSGVGLSSEQSAALRTSLLLLRRNAKLSGLLFWGKILGVRGDYYICRGTEEEDGGEELRRRQTFYSLNCMDWCLLPPATEAIIAEAQVIKGRFIGDPSHEYEHAVRNKVGEGDAAYEEEVTSHIKEETRLVATIAMIDKEAAVVPRGAFIKNALGQVKKNLCFRGLTVSEAKKQSSFFHFTFTVNPKKRSLLEKADLDPSIDFLDSLEHDIPRGCWSLQFEQGNSVVILRSLLWIGMTFYHVPLTPQHGCVYIGTGERNNDLPFMI
ncbi:PREDICTED: radial spoke head protein 9 homolog [Nanorana parkeri]|uniref:radial spoke head protein 9 homolog n=1 Tax=Nanorana parkeri TaxID=125878 RepID=UPI0008545C00|nr:PREDICTED: radial spoke head protein 9 homolog [Nanorana parkeri]